MNINKKLSITLFALVSLVTVGTSLAQPAQASSWRERAYRHNLRVEENLAAQGYYAPVAAPVAAPVVSSYYVPTYTPIHRHFHVY